MDLSILIIMAHFLADYPSQNLCHYSTTYSNVPLGLFNEPGPKSAVSGLPQVPGLHQEYGVRFECSAIQTLGIGPGGLALGLHRGLVLFIPWPGRRCWSWKSKVSKETTGMTEESGLIGMPIAGASLP